MLLACGFPPDYCEFGSNWESCSKIALTSFRRYYKAVDDSPELTKNEESSSEPPREAKQADRSIVKPAKGKKV